MIQIDNIDDLPFEFDKVIKASDRMYMNTLDPIYMYVRGMIKFHREELDTDIKYILVDEVPHRHQVSVLKRIEQEFDVICFFRTEDEDDIKSSSLVNVRNGQLNINVNIAEFNGKFAESKIYEVLLEDLKSIFGIYPIEIIEFFKYNNLDYSPFLGLTTG